MWEVCLELVDFAGQVDQPVVTQLWDLCLQKTVQTFSQSDNNKALEAAAKKVEELGGAFYPSSGRFNTLRFASDGASNPYPPASGLKCAPCVSAISVGSCRAVRALYFILVRCLNS